MTAAEKLIEWGVEKKQSEVAIKALKEGVDPRLVARITDLDLDAVLRLQAEIEK